MTAPRTRAGVVACLFAALWLAIGTAAPGVAQDREAIAEFSAQIAEDVRTDGIGGITAAVFLGDQVVWAEGFGWADPEGGVPAGVRTIYRTGSISKSFTGVLLADLVDEGVLGLDDAVVDVLPEVAAFGDAPNGMRPVTFRQMASHSAGLIREPELEGAAAGPIEDWGHKILASIPHTSFYAMPGTEYRYSNIGFGILGYALQRAMGESFISMVERRIFDPLGMSSSTFIVGPDLQHRLAVGFANAPAGEVNAEFPALEHAGRGYKVPNGGVYSTVGDLATFGAAVMGRTAHELLSTDIRSQVMSPQTPADSETKYGLGFSLNEITLQDRSEATLVAHGGSVAGYNAFLVFEPESGLGVVLLRNYNWGATNLGQAAQRLLIRLLGAERLEGGADR
ncbi:MAG: beta-lactamase family protein [Gemmatimonadota bacterium]|nr:beta-lactamase family protein [Gemmatimonadota bacterium]